MIVLRCSFPLALKLGVQLADTEGILRRVLAAEAAIRVDACTLPLYWPWALERQEVPRTSRRGQ
jgi:hypothetical protein